VSRNYTKCHRKCNCNKSGRYDKRTIESKLEVASKPVGNASAGRRVCTHAQTDGQCANIMASAPSIGCASTSFGWGKGGNVTSAGWQVTLCDPMWHVSSRSSGQPCELLYTCYLLTHITLHIHTRLLAYPASRR